jgi:hypothetical protein
MMPVRSDPSAMPCVHDHLDGATLHVDGVRMRVRAVITTIDPDRAGDVVVPTGLKNFEEFSLNPVVLWAHNRQTIPPIGICEWLDVQPHRIVAQTRFAQGIALAEDLFRLYEQKILRGWSIGFLPRKAVRIPHHGQTALRIDEWDLLEYSAVPIPENPGALTVALEKGLIRSPRLRRELLQVPDDRAGRVHRGPQRGDVFARLVQSA